MLIVNNFLIVIFSLMFHPVHVSLTNIEYSKAKNSFQITVKIFKDDFRKIIWQKYQVPIDVNDSIWQKQEKEIIAKYFNINLQSNAFKTNITAANIVKKEIDNLSVWYYLEIPAKKFKTQFKIKNTLMLELFSDQTNLLIFSYKSKEISEMMTQSQPTANFKLNE